MLRCADSSSGSSDPFACVGVDVGWSRYTATRSQTMFLKYEWSPLVVYMDQTPFGSFNLLRSSISWVPQIDMYGYLIIKKSELTQLTHFTACVFVVHVSSILKDPFRRSIENPKIHNTTSNTYTYCHRSLLGDWRFLCWRASRATPMYSHDPSDNEI